MEGALAELELANDNLARAIRWGIERLFQEDRSLARRRLEARIRKNLPDEQAKLTPAKKAKASKKTGKGSVQHLGEAKDAEQLIDEEEDDDGRPK